MNLIPIISKKQKKVDQCNLSQYFEKLPELLFRKGGVILGLNLKSAIVLLKKGERWAMK